MKLFCKGCGEDKSFYVEADYTVYRTSKYNCDAQGELNYDSEEVEGEDSDNFKVVEYKCGSCGSEVEDFGMLDVTVYSLKHTKKNGEWSEAELPEEEWDRQRALEIGATVL